MSISAINFSEISSTYSSFYSAKNSENIMLFQNNNSKTNRLYTPDFDKDGYPIADGETLTFEKGGWFSKDEYTYVCNGRESIGDIKQKFHLKDKAIQKCNSYIRDDDWVPDNGKKIYFHKEDVKIKK